MALAQAFWLAVSVWGLLNCVVFIAGYQYKTGGTWRHYPMGRHLMGLIVAIAVTFTLLVLSITIGPLGPWPWVGALVLVNLFLTQHNWLLLTHRWRSRVGDADDDTH